MAEIENPESHFQCTLAGMVFPDIQEHILWITANIYVQLLQKGVDSVHAKTNVHQGKTPLLAAAGVGLTDVVVELVDNGSQPTVIDARGRGLWQFAVSCSPSMQAWVERLKDGRGNQVPRIWAGQEVESAHSQQRFGQHAPNRHYRCLFLFWCKVAGSPGASPSGI